MLTCMRFYLLRTCCFRHPEMGRVGGVCGVGVGGMVTATNYGRLSYIVMMGVMR